MPSNFVLYGVLLLMLASLPFGSAVCDQCYGFLSGCGGSRESCPWTTVVASNVAAMAAGTGALMKLSEVLPNYWERFFPSSALKAICALASRSKNHAPYDFEGKSNKQIIVGVRNNYPPKEDAIIHIQSLIDNVDEHDAHADIKMKKLMSTLDAIKGIVPKAVVGITSSEGILLYVLFRCTMGICGKNPKTSSSFEFCDVCDDSVGGASSSTSHRSFSAALVRPISEAQCASLWNAYTGIGSAMGLFDVLAMTPFLEIAYHKKARTVVSWNVAFELTVLYIKAIDAEPDEYNFSNVVRKMGSGDTLLGDATAEAMLHYPVASIRSPCFRSGAGKAQTDGDGDKQYEGEIKGFDSTSKLGCYAHANGLPHLVKHVNKATSMCKFNHDLPFVASKRK